MHIYRGINHALIGLLWRLSEKRLFAAVTVVLPWSEAGQRYYNEGLLIEVIVIFLGVI